MGGYRVEASYYGENPERRLEKAPETIWSRIGARVDSSAIKIVSKRSLSTINFDRKTFDGQPIEQRPRAQRRELCDAYYREAFSS
jgi:predicted oxidoreductase